MKKGNHGVSKGLRTAKNAVFWGILYASLALTLAPPAVRADDGALGFSGTIDWKNLSLEARVSIDMKAAKLRMPTGRSQAEEIADMSFPDLARPTIYALRVDSSSSVVNEAERGDLSWDMLDRLLIGATREASVLSADFGSLESSFQLDLSSLLAALVRHRTPAEPERPLAASPTRPYTGIIIYADQPLPVHGTKRSDTLKPCFFPKIWSADMTLVYQKGFVDPHIAASRGIVRYGTDQNPTTYLDRIGDDPLKIVARGLFGVSPTDPIIANVDALRILSSPENRALLKEGRIVIVAGNLDEEGRTDGSR